MIGGDAERLEQQLDAAQRITKIGSWEWDAASGDVCWSDELYRIYGLAPRSLEITFESFLQRVHPEDRERVKREIGMALERRGRFAHRERIVRPDGSVRELESIGEVVLDVEGRPTGLIGTCRDITEERRREETIRLYADLVANAQIGLSVWQMDDPSDPGSLRLAAFNPAMEAAVGITLGPLVGTTLRTILPSETGQALADLMAGVPAEVRVRELATCSFGQSPHAPIFAARAFLLPDRCVGLALEDISARVRAQRLQEAEQHALEMLAQGAPLVEILGAIVRSVEELAPETLASVLLLDESGTRLRHGAAPSLPAAYNQSLDGQLIGPKAGSCGTAAFRRQPVFVDDIETDPLWEDYRQLVRPFGFRACWSSPISANDGRVLGTFALYYRRPRVADTASVELIARAAHVAGIAIARRQLDDELQALSERFEAIREDERSGIARDIHDQLGQTLTALKMDIAWVARRVDRAGAIGEKLAEMAREVDGVMEVVRRVSSELRPYLLDDLGLQAAIEWQAEEFERRTGIRCTVDSVLGDLELDRIFTTAVFRIFQEALTNVARHANATMVEVRLGLERGLLRLEVSDNGVGLPEAPSRRGALGLVGMRERARRLEGSCVVQRREPGGTKVSLTVPLRWSSESPTAPALRAAAAS